MHNCPFFLIKNRIMLISLIGGFDDANPYIIYITIFLLPAILLISCITILLTRSYSIKEAKLVGYVFSSYAVALISEFVRHMVPMNQSWWLTEFIVAPFILLGAAFTLHTMYIVIAKYTPIPFRFAPIIFYVPVVFMLAMIPIIGLNSDNFYSHTVWYYRDVPFYTTLFFIAFGSISLSTLPILYVGYRRCRNRNIFRLIRFLFIGQLIVFATYITCIVTFTLIPYPPMWPLYLGIFTTLMLFWGILRFNLTSSLANRYQTMMKLTPYAIVLLDEKQRVFDFNDAAMIWADFKVGMPAKDSFILKENILRFQSFMDRLVKENSLRGQLLTIQHAETGRTTYLSCNASVVYLNDGPFYYLVWYDQTSEIERQRQIREMAYVDSITTLSNRTYFNSYILTKNTPGTLILCDLNRFKQVNDTYGHQIGDELLQLFASFFKEYITPPHLSARLGGDEFAIYLHNCTSIDTIESLIYTLRVQCQTKPLTLKDGNEIFISASFGYAISKEPIKNLETVLHTADLNMYKEKKHLKNA